MDPVTLAASRAVGDKRYRRAASYGVFLPEGWDATWKTAKTAGSPNVAVVGDSITAGVATGTPTPDGILYGYVGRLHTLLSASLGTRAVFYPVYPYSSNSGIGAASGPFGTWSAAGSVTEFPGGVGIVQGHNTLAVWNLPVTIANDPVSGATPTGVDILTVDFVASQTWQYQLDSNAAVTVTTSSAASGGNSTAILRRTSVSGFTAGTHTLQIGQQSAATSLMVLGIVVYYGATGLGLARQGISSWRAVDYSVGTGNGQGTNGTNSQMPDHIKPWSGIQDANNISGTGFPWQPDLAIVALGLNDSGFGSHPDAYEAALTRFIHTFRTGKKNCSILLVATANGNPYSDNSVATFNSYSTYKRIMRSLATAYHCAYMDFDTIWEPNPIAAGLLTSGNPHPTGQGKGAGGGDGHLDMATRIAAVL